MFLVDNTNGRGSELARKGDPYFSLREVGDRAQEAGEHEHEYWLPLLKFLTKSRTDWTCAGNTLHLAAAKELQVSVPRPTAATSQLWGTPRLVQSQGPHKSQPQVDGHHGGDGNLHGGNQGGGQVLGFGSCPANQFDYLPTSKLSHPKMLLNWS